jgi:hypothetical protein
VASKKLRDPATRGQGTGAGLGNPLQHGLLALEPDHRCRRVHAAAQRFDGLDLLIPSGQQQLGRNPSQELVVHLLNLAARGFGGPHALGSTDAGR